MQTTNGTVTTNITVYTDDASRNNPLYLYAKQNDKRSRYIKAKIVSRAGDVFISAIGAIPHLNVLKPNGNIVDIEGAVNDDGSVTFLLINENDSENQPLSIAGKATCDIAIKNENNDIILTTSTFFIMVEASVTDMAGEAAKEDPSIMQEINALKTGKVDKEDGKGLSTNDYTDAEKSKLSGIATGANKTVVKTTTGTSNSYVMSQKAVTDAINAVSGSVAIRKFTTEDYPNLYSFSGLSWEEIATISKDSDPSLYWKIGDTKSVQVDSKINAEGCTVTFYNNDHTAYETSINDKELLIEMAHITANGQYLFSTNMSSGESGEFIERLVINNNDSPLEEWGVSGLTVGNEGYVKVEGLETEPITIPITIIGFNHDDVSDVRTYGKNKAGVTLMVGGSRTITGDARGNRTGLFFAPDMPDSVPGFMSNNTSTAGHGDLVFRSPLSRSLKLGPKTSTMDNGGTNWAECLMREYLNTMFVSRREQWPSSAPAFSGFLSALNPLATLLQQAVSVKKRTSLYYQPTNYYAAVVTTNDKVWLLSANEVWGSPANSPLDPSSFDPSPIQYPLNVEGAQYEYWKNGASKYFWRHADNNDESNIGSTENYDIYLRSALGSAVNPLKGDSYHNTTIYNKLLNTIYASSFCTYSPGDNTGKWGYILPCFCL